MASPKITLRLAGPDDASLLRRLELESPLVAKGVAFQVDRGDDYFAQRRMMGEATVVIAEVDGEPAGTTGAVLHTALVDGIPRRMLYIHHARVLPRFQRMGLGRACGQKLDEFFDDADVDSRYWWIDRTNTASQAMAKGAENRWSVCAVWGEIETAAHASEPPVSKVGRSALPEDAQRLADIFNSGHAGEQMFLPYTAERLAQRLAREPRYYSWAQIYHTGGAALGVWPHWVTLKLSRDGKPAGEMIVAAAMDYGCFPGHESDLVALLRGWRRTLHAAGAQRLSLFTSAPSRLFEIVRPFFAEIEEMDFWTPSIPEPAASRYGVYVDHVYF